METPNANIKIEKCKKTITQVQEVLRTIRTMTTQKCEGTPFTYKKNCTDSKCIVQKIVTKTSRTETLASINVNIEHELKEISQKLYLLKNGDSETAESVSEEPRKHEISQKSPFTCASLQKVNSPFRSSASKRLEYLLANSFDLKLDTTPQQQDTEDKTTDPIQKKHVLAKSSFALSPQELDAKSERPPNQEATFHQLCSLSQSEGSLQTNPVIVESNAELSPRKSETNSQIPPNEEVAFHQLDSSKQSKSYLQTPPVITKSNADFSSQKLETKSQIPPNQAVTFHQLDSLNETEDSLQMNRVITESKSCLSPTKSGAKSQRLFNQYTPFDQLDVINQVEDSLQTNPVITKLNSDLSSHQSEAKSQRCTDQDTTFDQCNQTEGSTQTHPVITNMKSDVSSPESEENTQEMLSSDVLYFNSTVEQQASTEFFDEMHDILEVLKIITQKNLISKKRNCFWRILRLLLPVFAILLIFQYDLKHEILNLFTNLDYKYPCGSPPV